MTDEAPRPNPSDATATPREVTGPLAGVRVVELAQWVAGPAVGGLMADWGADVIKVEAPTGDPQRALFAALGIDRALPNPPFALDNRGKRSVVLDLREADDRTSLDELLEQADVFVTNLRPGALERLDLAPADLSRRLPSLIVASQSGYGPVGPERDTPGYDIGAFLSRSGIARSYAPADAPPVNLRSGVGDHTTALATLSGVLAKLHERHVTGRGGIVETSLFQVGTYAAGWDLGIQATFGRLESMKPRHESPSPLVNSYEAADGRWFYLIGLEGERHFPSVCAAIDRLDLLEDPRFTSSASMRANSAALIGLLADAFARQPRDHWGRAFDDHQVWWAPCQTMAEVVVDPQAAALELFHATEAPDDPEGRVRTVASPVWFDGTPVAPPGRVPSLGEHTSEVLEELRQVSDDDADT